jgi:WD40 repeat protein
LLNAYRGLTLSIQTGDCMSSTQAHNDFVKTLLVIPWLNILVSGGSDRQINLWDLLPFKAGVANDASRGLQKLKTLKEHTRPVEALALAEPGTLGCALNEAIFYSADSMGVIRSWHVKRDQTITASGSNTTARDNGVTVTKKDVFEGHHTSVPEMMVGEGGLWSGKYDLLHHAKVIPDHSFPFQRRSITKSSSTRSRVQSHHSLQHPSFIQTTSSRSSSYLRLSIRQLRYSSLAQLTRISAYMTSLRFWKALGSRIQAAM